MVKICSFLLLVSFVSVSYCQDQMEETWNSVDCPKSCACASKFNERYQTSLRTVDCQERNLFEFPYTLPSDMQVLLLRNNKIRRVEVRSNLRDLIHIDLSHNLLHSVNFGDEYRDFYNLKSIDLSFNRLDRLTDFTFKSLFGLEDLDLSDNIITGITDDAFGGLSKLETLRLSGNRLAYLQSYWWNHLTNVYNVYLDRNRFTFVQSESFKSLHQCLRLDLSRNKIYRVNEKAFAGLDKLETLILEANFLNVVPREALQHLKSLKSVNLARNAFFKVRTDDFANLPSLKDINLSNMQRLRLVERGSFKNLPQLLVVEMHDNPYLGYLDRSAFVNAPQVTHLLVHNNNLTVFERETIDTLPALEEVSFYGNPLSCDCNAHWLNKFLTEPVEHQRNIGFREAERIVCDGPFEHKFKLFTTLHPGDMPRTCAPRILVMFDKTNIRKQGDDITYDCRAVGSPEPRITWVSPEGDAINPSTYHVRRVLINGNTLVIRHIKTEDAGLYACIAENEAGSAATQTQLNVSSIQVELFVRRVDASSVTVSWNGADRDNNIFQLLYRPLEPTSRHQYAATVTPIMKTYSIQNLQPSTPYEVCIAFEDDDNVVVHISCSYITTKGFDSSYSSLERTSNVAVGAALGIVACVLIVVCLLAVGLKRKQDRQQLSTSFLRQSSSAHCRDELLSISTDSLTITTNVYSPLINDFCKLTDSQFKQLIYV